ncbi:tRNA (adenosine(37)-N6)-threonylcarbamoyltransferase complex dimerization subunit type 1 TsaB [Proteiniclasticum ruminis]|jgi:tRNA threonylcarbamoyl adenosine modification protein YeaZ|uniref:tRNA (adenosine(37)-N6)-threonylcarbamoyltransferase complex dimerization subunit type 1 TsaB n=1 Tax=Proteiniclasticum ruminis TaxID=398199 RepID=UPI001B3F68B7|nr:tRNA (adenosine(37)-N6)-threonylcarbamoyltransferase complex dimerization subunit type 1 TsaB [Proteiniclasticum ruminis]MBP9920987.1 tRNA (adenosine(37)-N6)-threonylcarbamoyltransferase complex dimerization subunit type 1 TsaB [Proteiniclasticum sp.]
MNILSIDTSSSNCTAAVVRDYETLGEISINFNLQHSVLLMPLVEELLEKLHMAPTDLSAITVSKGPGSFTGLRIGLAAAKGMALALDIPIYAADALAALAYGAFGYQGLIIPMVDALRNGYYTGFYTFTEGKLVTIMEPAILTLDEVMDKVANETKEIMIMGDIISKIPGEKLQFRKNIILAPQNLNIPKASTLPYLLRNKIENEEKEDIYSLVPLYMRKSQAEYEYEKKQGRLL